MKFSNSFQEFAFKQSVERALERVKTILDTTRHPRLADDPDCEELHKYDDKFALAEFLLNTGIAAKMNALERLGMDAEKLKQVSKWVHEDKQSVTLRFEAEDSCQFLKEGLVELSSMGPSREVETTTTAFLGMGTSTKTEKVQTKVVSKVKENHWKVSLAYRLVVFHGTDASDALELQSRSSSMVLVTSGGHQVGGRLGSPQSQPTSPLPEKTVHDPIDLNLTWFLQKISPRDFECQFSIDRDSIKAHKNCKTPRRNPDVDEAYEFDAALRRWSMATIDFFLHRVERDIMNKHHPVGPEPATPTLMVGSTARIRGLQKEPTFNGKEVRIIDFNEEQQRYKVEPVDPKSGLPKTLLIKPQNIASDEPTAPQNAPPLSGVSDEQIFGPVLPLMENGSILPMGDVTSFLNEQTRSLDEALGNLAQTYPPRQLMKLVSVAEATIVQVGLHMATLSNQCTSGVDFIENMLKDQLIQAIGKEVNSKDFDKFIRYHNQRFFGREFAPTPFSYAIRRPEHFPDGIVSIEATGDKREPIETWVRHVPGGTGAPPMYMPINASTTIELCGDRFLHGWMLHKFRTTRRPNYELVARARQFSSFLLVVGTMAGADKFDPKHAIILQNKDEVLIPLLANPLPSAKEFRDAIVSLSPEQQSFAKAYRAMQLESSVFGVCVIQLKPQLEKLLGLPDGALTKEIQLTQHLMSLFVEYQIPSDLLSFTGDENAPVGEKVAAVRGFVEGVLDVIETEKKKQIEEEARKADVRHDMAAPGYSPFHAAQNEPMAVGAIEEVRETSRMFRSSAQPLRAPAPAEMMDPRPGAFRTDSASAGSMTTASSSVMTAAASNMSPRTRQKSRKLANSPMREKKSLAAPLVQTQSQLVPNQTELGRETITSNATGDDFTTIPRLLDASLEKHDLDNALRSTIIKAASTWRRSRQANLLVAPQTSSLDEKDIQTELKKAFDILDAISRSGTLPIVCSELHVVVGVSHCFENDVMGTIIQDNIDPIMKVERSSLLLASTIHGKSATTLLSSDHTERMTRTFPELMAPAAAGDVEVFHDNDS